MCCGKVCATISAVLIMIQALCGVVFNVVCLSIFKCSLVPSDLPGPLANFYAYYLYDSGSSECRNKLLLESENGFAAKVFVLSASKPSSIDSNTDASANAVFQQIYIAVHLAWFVSALITVLGCCTKSKMLRLPCLLVTIGVVVLDVVVMGLYIADLVEHGKDNGFSIDLNVPGDSNLGNNIEDLTEELNVWFAMSMQPILYSRFIIFLISNITTAITLLTSLCC